MALLLMSKTELSRAEILYQVCEDKITLTAAAGLLHLSRRQATRLLAAYRAQGPSGLISRKRGKPSNRRHSEAFRDHVIALVRQHYHDFGPTLAAEKLAELHATTVSVETLRTWLTAAGLWQSRKERKKQVKQPRNRRLLWRADPDRWLASLVV
jgi:hypothetical protein